MPRPLRSAFRVALVAALAMACAPAAAGDFAREAWREDFAQLKTELARAYANLDWAVAERRMDLPALSRMTEAQLGRATSDEEARRVFDRFLDEFGDGHLYIDWPRPARAKPADPAPAPDAKPATRTCADLGYRAWRDPGLDFSAVPGWEKLDTAESASFPAGVLATPGGARLGIVRISLFMEQAVPEACAQVHREPAPCDGDCAARVQAEVGRRISRDLAAQLRALAARKVGAIVIDVTGNGGGSDWADAATRIVTAPGLEAPRMSFIRHPHWVKQSKDRLADVESDLARKDLAPAVRADLEDARKTLARAAAVAAEPCERGGVWEGRPACPLVAPSMFRSTGTLATLPAYSTRGLAGDHALSMPSRYDFTEGAWRGKLALLVDHGTGSAAELFAATLQDNRRATVIGSLTHGSGCGYTGGGIAIRLARSGATVKVPDCVRYRADGSNEVEGITPDVLVAWRKGLSRHQRSARAAAALFKWAEAAIAKGR